LAVADELRRRDSQRQLLFIGGRKGPEGRLAEQEGIPFEALPVKGVLGTGLKSAGTLFSLLQSLLRCRRIYRAFRPDCVLGFGSYAGFVPVLLANWQKVPCAVHEQNSQPGVTNRILGKRADRVFLSFPDEHGFFDPDKTQVIGNPVRRTLIALRYKEKSYVHQSTGHVLIIGGSQGARAINEAIVGSLPQFQTHAIRLMHQTGEADFERVKQAYREHGFDESLVAPFIDDMAAAYDWADLVVCRAGASTVAELTAIGRPSIVIPFPYAVHKHQLTNAKLLAKAGAAIVLEQSYLSEIDLARVVSDVLAVPEKLQEMGAAARSLGKPQAASELIDELEELAAGVP
jgi:UDP-N-acetylglucosamine--N-acetylmuramyl-(pentapeptide) pyrophosphoryl-undecaprenol N-acetylglucosamine transferase